LIGFGLGFAVYFMPWQGRRQGKNLPLLAIALIVFTGAMIAIHPTVLTRFEESYAGNIVNRQQINEASLSMVLERPLIGWHPVALWEELARRTGEVWGTKDAHNSFFYLLLEVGVIGAAPYVMAIYLCLFGAWRGRHGPLARVPLALMVCVLSANLAHTYITRKPQWMVLALAAAVGSAAAQRKTNPMALRPRPNKVPESAR
jgi:O-antigen ligase